MDGKWWTNVMNEVIQMCHFMYCSVSGLMFFKIFN